GGLQALGANDHRTLACQLPGQFAHGLSRTNQQHRVAAAELAQVSGGFNARFEPNARQVDRIATFPGDGYGDGGIARPQRHPTATGRPPRRPMQASPVPHAPPPTTPIWSYPFTG